MHAARGTRPTGRRAGRQGLTRQPQQAAGLGIGCQAGRQGHQRPLHQTQQAVGDNQSLHAQPAAPVLCCSPHASARPWHSTVRHSTQHTARRQNCAALAQPHPAHLQDVCHGDLKQALPRGHPRRRQRLLLPQVGRALIGGQALHNAVELSIGSRGLHSQRLDVGAHLQAGRQAGGPAAGGRRQRQLRHDSSTAEGASCRWG